MADVSLYRNVKNRIAAVDILRPLYLFFASFYHLGSYAFYDHDAEVQSLVQSQPLLEYLIWPGYQAFAVMGHWLTAVTCFLIGFRQQPGRFYKWMYLVLGVGTALAFFSDKTFWETGLIPWDLFGTLILGLISAQLMYLRFGQKFGLWLFVFSILGMLLPTELLTNQLNIPTFWDIILFGDCSIGNLCYWPVFPWIFFVWASYGAGLFFQTHDMRKYKLPTLVIFIGIAICTLAFSTPIADSKTVNFTNWGVYLFQDSRERLLFWLSLHFAVLVGLSFEPIKSWLAPIGTRMSRLTINRYFWLAYVTQGVTSYYFAKFLRYEFLDHPWLFVFVVLIHMPLVEALASALAYFLTRKGATGNT